MKKESQNPSSPTHPALDEHLRSGGSTFDPRTGENLAGRNLWAVGAVPESAHYSEHPITQEEYDSFAGRHAGLLQHPNSAIGTAFNHQTGLHSMEVVGLSSNKNAANDLAASLGENHIYHLGRGEKHPTNHEGDRPIIPSSPDNRLSDLRSNTPEKQPFSGVHYSDAKLDSIDGNRRGASGSGQESQRLRLGSQTGAGKDAPPGFYAYSSDSIADPKDAMKKNAHPVSGAFAFSDVATDPTFREAHAKSKQEAINNGADEQTAHQLGLNGAEHAIRDAGYDGYYSSLHPGNFFIFGSYITNQGKPQPSGK